MIQNKFSISDKFDIDGEKMQYFLSQFSQSVPSTIPQYEDVSDDVFAANRYVC